MHNFWTLVKFEYKKIFQRKSVIIAIALGFGIAVFSCFTMVLNGNSNSDYSQENLSAYDAMQQDKAYEKALAGRQLDGALILEASDAYKHIDTSAQNYTQTDEYQKHARAYSCVYTLIDSAYAQPGKAFNVSDFQAISQQDANSYYDIREKQYRTNLSNNYLYSASDVEKVMELDADVQKPFVMEYKDGYQRFLSLSLSTMVILLFVISFCVSPIFSDEYAKRTDGLILASKNGKKILVRAKIFTLVTFAMGLALLFIASTYFCCMGIYGFDGTNAQIQLLIPEITYNCTLLGAAVIVSITGLIGVLLHASICAVTSSVSKNAIVPMAVSVVLVLAGMFGGTSSAFVAKLRLFLPSAMGSFWDMSKQFVFDVFGMQIMLYQMVCVAGAIFCAVLFLLAVQGFRRHQVS